MEKPKKVSENAVKAKIKLALGGNGKTVLFPNPTGIGVVGQIVPFNFGDKSAAVNNPRYISFGLGSIPGAKKGGEFPDFIGWHETTITPEMVGLNVAIFTGIEVKRPNKKPTEGQQKKINLIRSRGGLAGCARSVEEAQEIINEIDIRAELNK
jgi:hypothetical protein